MKSRGVLATLDSVREVINREREKKEKEEKERERKTVNRSPSGKGGEKFSAGARVTRNSCSRKTEKSSLVHHSASFWLSRYRRGHRRRLLRPRRFFSD